MRLMSHLLSMLIWKWLCHWSMLNICPKPMMHQINLERGLFWSKNIWPNDVWLTKCLANTAVITSFGQKTFGIWPKGIWHLAYLTFGEHLLYYVILSCRHDVFMTSFGQNTFGYNVWLAFLVLCHFGCQTWYFVDTFVTLSFGRKTLGRHDT